MIKPEGEEDRGQGDVRRVRPYILHANKQHNEHYTKNNVLDTLFHNFPSLNHSSFMEILEILEVGTCDVDVYVSKLVVR